jgi:glycosyltransferase involved in cell wall biosynthesis
MHVTVVIPLYNKVDTIVRAILSVQSQTHRDFELIVVDDGSTDASPALVENLLDSGVSLIRQSNAGPGAARNAGAAAGRGELIAFLDADDEWRPEFLARAVASFQDHSDCRAYVCGYDAGAYRSERPNKVAELDLSGPAMVDAALSGAQIKRQVDAMHSSCTVVRRAAFEAAGGFYAAERCLYGEDSYLWIQVLLSGPIFWDQGEHVLFHVEDSSLGYAVRHRYRARPIVSSGMVVLREKLDSPWQQTLSRAVNHFAQLDVYDLACSGAFEEAGRLRAQYGIGSRLDMLLDRLRYMKRRYLSSGQ